MKKFIAPFILFLTLFIGFNTDASAKDLFKKFGIGADSTIASFGESERGLSLVYYVSKNFGLQLIMGMEMTKAEVKTNDGKFDTTITEWNVSLRGLIPIIMANDANLTAVVGFTASGRASDGFKSNLEEFQKYNDGYQFSFDLGVRPEWFVTEHFSIHTQVGIGFNIITEKGSTILTGLDSDGGVHHSTKGSGISMNFFQNVDLFGSAGFTFWFGKL